MGAYTLVDWGIGLQCDGTACMTRALEAKDSTTPPTTCGDVGAAHACYFWPLDPLHPSYGWASGASTAVLPAPALMHPATVSRPALGGTGYSGHGAEWWAAHAQHKSVAALQVVCAQCCCMHSRLFEGLLRLQHTGWLIMTQPMWGVPGAATARGAPMVLATEALERLLGANPCEQVV